MLWTQSGLAAVAVLIAAGHTTTAAAQPMRGPWDSRPMQMRGCQLTAEQQAAARKIHQQHEPRLFNLRQQQLSRQYALNALVASPSADQKQIQSLINDIGRLEERHLQEQVALQQDLVKQGIPSSGLGACPGCTMQDGDMMGGRSGMMMGKGDMMGPR